MIKKFVWPEAYVVECSSKPLGIWKRLNLAWSCLFAQGVRGLCLEAPDWAKEKGK
jgi:hypothetical protein